MTIYYLMVKTHNITGLKYLCQTSKQDPYNYSGSGIDWKTHIKLFGNSVSTEIIAECKSKPELNKQGRYYSKLWNIVNGQDDYGNKIWANRIPETGGGGSPSTQTREKLRQSQLGIKKPPRTKDHIEKLASSQRGKKKPRTSEHQRVLNDCVKKNWEDNPNRRLKTAAVEKSNKGRKHTSEALMKKRQAMLEYWKIKKALAS